MSRFKYKTRGNSSPHQKVNVYYSCHPKDFEMYFEKISSEILEVYDCVIWYDSKMGESYNEEVYEFLGQMQLVVIPITTYFLTYESDSLNNDFAFALDNRIPVLPIMCEKRLESIFNCKCGDLQYLDRFTTDLLELNYEEKLQRFLNKVLIGDETHQRIRDAFSAYIFLSYRKKDRKYIHKLMKLIHKNKDCRDVAIWYDGFLVPGEDFNDSIKQAILKSKLFVMAVTPNLIEEENYVMTKEYPLAKQEKKNILPIEIVATQKEILAQKYENIPECYDVKDEARIREVVGKYIKGSNEKNNDSCEHAFLMGLAYLSGIDVEINYDWALELIVFAAERGVVEAIEKLVEMYRYAIGVEYSLTNVIQWQKILVELLSGKFEEEQKEEEGIKLQSALAELSEYYIQIGAIGKARECIVHQREICKDIKDKYFYIMSYLLLGNTEKELGNYDAAQEQYLSGLDLSTEYIIQNDRKEGERLLAFFYDRLTRITLLQGKVSEAENYALKTVEIYNTIQGKDNSNKICRGLMICNINIADVYIEKAELKEAYKYALKGYCICEQIENEEKVIEIKYDMAMCKLRLGKISELQGEMLCAEKHYIDAKNLIKKLCENRKVLDYYSTLATINSNLGNIWSYVKI